MTKKICSVCGNQIMIPFGDYPYKTCRECREKDRYYRQSRGRKPKREAKDKLSETVIEIEEYNKKHGTNYTYGRYMAAKEHGWLK